MNAHLISRGGCAVSIDTSAQATTEPISDIDVIMVALDESGKPVELRAASQAAH
jgi:hypothetical protein